MMGVLNFHSDICMIASWASRCIPKTGSSLHIFFSKSIDLHKNIIDAVHFWANVSTELAAYLHPVWQNCFDLILMLMHR